MGIYLQIDGIQGPVTAKGLEGFIQAESFTSNIQRKLATQAGAVSNRETSKPVFSEITLTKIVDKTTPLLFTEATVGASKSNAVVKFISAGSNLNEYLTITLGNVMISSQTLDTTDRNVSDDGENNRSDRPTESITLNFTKIEVKYTPYDNQNNVGSPIPAGYDLETAQAQ
jgi:type VI secretion system secreted protein Hcp